MIDKNIVIQEILKSPPSFIIAGGVTLIVVGVVGGIPLTSVVVEAPEWRAISIFIGLVLIFLSSVLWYWHKKEDVKEKEGQVKERETSEVVHVYLQRKDVHWGPFNAKVSYRYWACGTSLIGVVERKLVQMYLKRGVRDVKILLPDTSTGCVAREQLNLFNKFPDLIVDQIALAEASFKNLETQIRQYDKGVENYLRRYCGIMYANITIFDEDAFISFYNCTGVGDSSFTLHFNRKNNQEGYRLVEEEFLRMWNAEGSYGRKVRGASIIFVNDKNKILLYLRDEKKGIPFANKWDLLGGQVEVGETPMECIIREVEEEIALDLRDLEIHLFNVYDMDDRVEYTFWQKRDLNIKEIKLQEGQYLRWFTEREIRLMPESEIAFNFKKILLDFLQKRPFVS